MVELLVVLGIVAIMAAIVSPLIPSLLRGNQMDSNVNALAGILDEAREAAMAGNTYIWVAVTDPIAGSPGGGVWVATFQSLDGTEAQSSTISSAPWNATLTLPGGNLQLHNKLQNLPAVEVVVDPPTISGAPTLQSINTAVTASANASTPARPTPPAYPAAATSLQGGTTSWTVSAGGSRTFVHVIEFTPNGEAHVPTWSANIQFALVPAIGKTTNSVLFNVSRLTGKATVYRM
jgi:type II secretory pathway pseudopilin PulG